MIEHMIGLHTNPEYREHMRRAREARAAAVYAAFGPVRRGAGWLAEAIRGAAARIRASRRRAATLRELSRLGDRELDDIGLTRGAVEALEAGVPMHEILPDRSRDLAPRRRSAEVVAMRPAARRAEPCPDCPEAAA